MLFSQEETKRLEPHQRGSMRMELSEIKLNDKECNSLASSEHWRVLNSFLWLPVRVGTWVGGRAYWKRQVNF